MMHLAPSIAVVLRNAPKRKEITKILQRAGLRICVYSNLEALKLVLGIVKDLPNALIVGSSTANEEKRDLEVICQTIGAFIVSEDSCDDHAFRELVDGYLAEPFLKEEISDLLEKSFIKRQIKSVGRVIKYHNLKIDLALGKFYKNDREVQLSDREFEIIKCFMQCPRRTFSRQEIGTLAWHGAPMIRKRSVDTHVNKLRRIVNSVGENVVAIKTLYKSGYKLVPIKSSAEGNNAAEIESQIAMEPVEA